MAKKKIILDKEIEEIKKLAGTTKIVIGTNETLNFLRQGKIEKVYLSSNTPEGVKADVISLANHAEIIELDVSNTDLGTICKKKFVISIIGVKKDE